MKAQIHAGGRGKGGGVKIATSVEEAADLASKILGMTLVTHQTGPEGRVVRRLLVEETLPIEKELYLGILVDRAEGKPVFMASAAGGMEIEQVAEENPGAILKQYIDPGMGLEALLLASAAAILGGLSNVWAAASGGFLLGLATELPLLWLSPAWQSPIAFGILLLVVLVRPQGIFGTRVMLRRR